jgi:hypothetical protein
MEVDGIPKLKKECMELRQRKKHELKQTMHMRKH